MHWMLERLPTLVAVLFMAVARRKRKSAGKTPRRAAKKSSRVVRRVVRKGKKRQASKRSTRAAKPEVVKQPAEPSEPLPEPTPPFGRAILLIPPDGTYVETAYPTFRWLSVGGATRYEVHWSEDSTLSTRHATISLATEATVPVEKPLRPNGTYYWRVRGGNDAGWGHWSLVASFRVLEESQ